MEPAADAFVIDDEVGICRYLSAALGQLGLAAESFHTADAAIAAFERGKPEIVFLDIDLGGTDAVDVIRALGEMRYAGIVQLMSGAKSALLDDVHRIGALRGLNMCPPLQKPFRSDAIKAGGRQRAPLGSPRDHHLPCTRDRAQARRGHRQRLARVVVSTARSTCARAASQAPRRSSSPAIPCRASPSSRGCCRKPARPPGRPSPSASSPKPSTIGAISPEPASDRASPSAPASMRSPTGTSWRSRADSGRRATSGPASSSRSASTRSSRTSISRTRSPPSCASTTSRSAIDNFGAGFSSFERLRELPFSELKLHPGFVAGCGRDDKNAGICRAAIDLAHRFGIVAVADGLESEADMRALQGMGCDVGQGPLLAEPMPKSELMDVFGERARTKHAWIG